MLILCLSSAAIIGIIATVVTVLALRRAPDGEETATGFRTVEAKAARVASTTRERRLYRRQPLAPHHI